MTDKEALAAIVDYWLMFAGIGLVGAVVLSIKGVATQSTPSFTGGMW